MKKNIKFEQALKDLEKIVEELEIGELSLEQSLKQYEEGVKLTSFCSGKLMEAEKKVAILSQATLIAEKEHEETAS